MTLSSTASSPVDGGSAFPRIIPAGYRAPAGRLSRNWREPPAHAIATGEDRRIGRLRLDPDDRTPVRSSLGAPPRGLHAAVGDNPGFGAPDYHASRPAAWDWTPLVLVTSRMTKWTGPTTPFQ